MFFKPLPTLIFFIKKKKKGTSSISKEEKKKKEHSSLSHFQPLFFPMMTVGACSPNPGDPWKKIRTLSI